MLAQSGDIVLSVYRSNDKRALKFQKQLKEISLESDIIKADISKQAGVDAVVDYVGSSLDVSIFL